MPRSYRHIKEYEKEILELRKQGKTKQEICEKYGFSKGLFCTVRTIWGGSFPHTCFLNCILIFNSRSFGQKPGCRCNNFCSQAYRSQSVSLHRYNQSVTTQNQGIVHSFKSLQT